MTRLSSRDIKRLRSVAMFHSSIIVVIKTLLLGLLICSLAVTSSFQSSTYPTLTVSQCFKSNSIPKVVFECPSTDHLIKILRAFHGLRPAGDDVTISRDCDTGGVTSDVDPACSYCPGDCVDDSINEVYDWSSCIGSTSCVRTVLQSFIPSCPSPNKFSEYLQVEYQCIPTDTILNICNDIQRVTSEGGELTSPNYPLNYPSNEDCECTLTADDPSSRLVLSFYDLFLETKAGRCRADWLMIRQGSENHRHCGVIMSGTKNMTTTTSAVSLHFHSDSGQQTPPDVNTQLAKPFKGFWLRFDTDSSVNVVCRKLPVNDPATQEAQLDVDYDSHPVFAPRDVTDDVRTPLDNNAITTLQPTAAAAAGGGGDVIQHVIAGEDEMTTHDATFTTSGNRKLEKMNSGLKPGKNRIYDVAVVATGEEKQLASSASTRWRSRRSHVTFHCIVVVSCFLSGLVMTSY